MRAFDYAASEDELGAFVNSVRAQPGRRDELVPLLSHGHAVYEGRGRNEVLRIRGFLLAAFETVGLPSEALRWVLEELESSQSAYLVAAAAKALRGADAMSPELIPYLKAALTNVQYHDDLLSFETIRPTWPLARHTTAVHEIIRTFGSLGEHGRDALPFLRGLLVQPHFGHEAFGVIESAIAAIEQSRSGSCCCSVPVAKSPEPSATGSSDVYDVEFEDQDGCRETFGVAFRGKPTVVAFFYTRCGNPNKCSLTVTKLGQLQGRLEERGLAGRVRVAAASYDPGYDTPDRLRGYCGNRGFVFDVDNRAWRADPSRFDAVRKFFHLGAAYAGSIVSRHTIELYVLDARASVVASFENLHWDVDAVVDEVTKIIGPRAVGELA